MNGTVVVSIQCYAYNHEPYIRDCLEGFVNQKTNFRFQAVVHDDASTDNTASIIMEYAEKYPDIIIPIIESENMYSKHISIRQIISPYLTGKYLAICEGDDYWIDPYKLQKQVDYLDNHPNCAMCYTRLQVNENGIVPTKPIGGSNVTFNELLRENTVATVTTLCRNDVDQKYIEEIKPEQKHWKMGDYPRWLWMSKEWTIGFLNDVTAVYRILPESASHSKSLQKRLSFIDGEYAIRCFFNDYFNAGMEDVLLKDYYINKMYDISLHGDILLASKTYNEAIKKDWTLIFNYKLYVYLLRSLKKYLKEGSNNVGD